MAIIEVVGESGAGKTTVVEILEKDLGFQSERYTATLEPGQQEG